MGFSLLGVWIYWVVPGTVVFAAATVHFWRRSASTPNRRKRVVRAAALIYALFFLICMMGYRRML